MSAAVGSLFGPLGTQLGFGYEVARGAPKPLASYDYRGNRTGGELDFSSEYGDRDIVEYRDKAGNKQTSKASDFIANVLPELQRVGQEEDALALKQREQEAQQAALNQQDTALKTISRKKPKPKGGTILTSPLGLLGNSNSSAKTLIGA